MNKETCQGNHFPNDEGGPGGSLEELRVSLHELYEYLLNIDDTVVDRIAAPITVNVVVEKQKLTQF